MEKTKRVAWVTDIHLNFMSGKETEGFCRTILLAEPDAVLIGGDIGEASDIGCYLRILEEKLQMPIYFVLGNHDYYRGSIHIVREHVRELAGKSICLHWLTGKGVIEMTSETGLVGHDS